MKKHIRIVISSCIVFVLFLLISASTFAQSENALNFDNIDDQVEVPGASARIAGSNQISLTCWVKPMNSNIVFPDYDGFAGIRNNVDADFYIVQFGNRRVEARFRNSSGVNFDVVDTTIEIGVWQHYTLTYNGSELTLYRNGIVVGNTIANGNITNTTVPFTIGSMVYSAFNYFLLGEVDEVTLWNRFLSPFQIRCLANFGTSPSTLGLQLYYKCNQGTAGGINVGQTSLTDETGNSNGLFSGFALSGPTSNFVSGVTTVTDIADNICPGSTYTFGLQSLTSPGIYTQSFPSASGCDSTVRLTLTVGINDAVSLSGNTLTALQANAQYQWIDCSNGNQPIPGETGQVFVAPTVGPYAVIITNGSCTDTSVCTAIPTLGISSLQNFNGVTIFPNPVQDQLTIRLTNSEIEVMVSITDLTGRLVYNEQFSGDQLAIQTTEWAKGVYAVTVRSGDKQSTYRISK
jgi:hypothetical protein